MKFEIPNEKKNFDPYLLNKEGGQFFQLLVGQRWEKFRQSQPSILYTFSKPLVPTFIHVVDHLVHNITTKK